MENIVRIDREAKQLLDLYTKHTSAEVSGLGEVRHENGVFTVTKIHLLEQEVTCSTTDLTQESVSNLILKKMTDGEDPASLRLWWHSHYNMQVFWSGTDQNTIKNFGNDWMISIVTNQAQDYLCRLDIFSPVRICIDNLALKVVDKEDPGLISWVKKEINKKVTQIIPALPKQKRVGGAWGYSSIWKGGVFED